MKKHSNKPRKVEMLDKDGNVLRAFVSVNDAAREMYTDPIRIRRACKDSKCTCIGYHWRYADGVKA